MKVVSRTDNLMVIKDLGSANWVLILACLVFSTAIFYAEGFNGDWVSKMVLALFFVVGLFLVFSSEHTTISVDKAAESILIKRSKIVSSNQKNYRFDEISKIILKEDRGNDAKDASAVSYNIQLILKDGEHVNFINNPPRVSSIFAKKQKRVEIAKEVAAMVGVPFEERGEFGFGEVVGVFKQVIDLASKGHIKNTMEGKEENKNLEEK